MFASPPALDLAVRYHRAGDLPRAEQLYRQILQESPRHADALHLLGLVAHQRGDSTQAVAYISQALELKPGFAEAHNNLGNALRGLGKSAEAEAAYRQALRLKPHYPEAHGNLGVVLAEQGKLDDAVAAYQEALRLKPDLAEAHGNLGAALTGQGKLDEAEAAHRQALALRPDYAEGHNNLGNVLRERGKLEEAIACFRQALRLNPGYAVAHNNLAIALAERGDWEEAMAAYRQALALDPGYAHAHSNLGNALREQGRLDEALACQRQALRLQPHSVEGLNNLGNVLRDQARLEEAVDAYQQALRLQPDSADIHSNLAAAWLLLGNFEDGWTEYEWRWKTKEFSPPTFPQPWWDGSELDGRTILLHAEQGLGDTLHFIRYAPLVQQRGGRVIVACPPMILRLLSSCGGIDQLVSQDSSLPPFDVHAPLLSLPRLLGTSLATVPAEVPYLAAEPDLVRRWQQELEQVSGFRIGICWQGNPKYRWDRWRSLPLTHFAPLARLEGVRLFSLQQRAGLEQLAAVDSSWPVTNLGPRLDQGGAFVDTAAVIKNLDLVVTSDTALAHLAGALGVPVWMAVPFAPAFRWLLHREDSPWYPTMRLFRQPRPGDWPAVFERIAAEIQKQLLRPAPEKSTQIKVEIAPGELLDKITILEIKSGRITDAAKLRNVHRELAALRAAAERAVEPSEQLETLTTELRTVNAALWDIEDAIRLCERSSDFGPRFVALARSVYHQNDERAALKRRINELLGSALVEEKAYTSYR